MATLTGTDLLLIQRLDTLQNQELYSVTLDVFSEYVGLHSNAILASLTDQVEDNTARITNLEESMSKVVNKLTLLHYDVERHDSEIEVLQKSVTDLRSSVEEINTKAKVNLNYRWIENWNDPNDIQSGEMYVGLDNYDGTISKVYYSRTDADGYSVSEPYIFAGETLELSSAYNASPANPSKLRYRSIHLVTEELEIEANYIAISVKTIHSYGEEPYYVEGTNDFITRSDFYPTATDLEELENHVEETYLPLNGSKSMTGDLTILKTTPKITLNGSQSYISFTTAFSILQGNSKRIDIDSSGNISFTKPLDMGGATINNLVDGITEKSAVTKKYVDDKVQAIDDQLDDPFEPGDQVAKTSTSGVEVGGFALVNSTLYVRI